MTKRGRGWCFCCRGFQSSDRFLCSVSPEQVLVWKQPRLDGACATWDCVYVSSCSSGNLFELKQRREHREKCVSSVEARPDEMLSARCVSSPWGLVWAAVGPPLRSSGWPGWKNIEQRWPGSLAKWCHYKFIQKAQLHRAPDLEKIRLILKLNALLEME